MLSRILCNYASRLGRKLVYVDLDCRNNSLGLSNTIGAIQIAKPVSVEHEFMEGLGSPPSLVYFTGDSRKTRELIFDSLLRRVIDDINMKFENCAETNYGGMVANTSGCQTPEDFQEIEAISRTGVHNRGFGSRMRLAKPYFFLNLRLKFGKFLIF